MLFTINSGFPHDRPEPTVEMPKRHLRVLVMEAAGNHPYTSAQTEALRYTDQLL